MKYKKIIVSLLIVCSSVVKAGSTNMDYLNLANSYVQAWFKTQMSTATKADLEHYLTDVAYQYLPYDKTDVREAGGKDVLRGGMAQWLASNSDYKATINSINFSNNLIIIDYNSSTTVIDAKPKKRE